MKLVDILAELNLENGSNYKNSILKKYSDNVELQRLLKMTYDKVTHTYGITMKNIPEYTNNFNYNISTALDILETQFVTRNVTGIAANILLTELLKTLSPEDSLIIERVIERDQKINLGRTEINKVFKGLIVKPVYMRCGIYSTDKATEGKIKKGTSKNISFPAILQLKADGTYREFKVENSIVTCRSRSGESYIYPILNESFSNLEDGIYVGELTVKGEPNRSKANGLINSSNPPHDLIQAELWDFITLEEYSKAALKDKNNKCTTTYDIRWNNLNNIILGNNIMLIPSIEVNNLEEAVEQTSIWMKEGYEGAILKDKRGILKDGTSKHQLKLKIALSVDVRITGFKEGKKGTKRESTFGSILFSTDDNKIQGRTSGFTDKQLEDFNSRREELIGKVIEVEANDITKGRDNDFYALSHPRFIEIRDDKDYTDDLERAFESLELAKMFKNR